MKIIKDLSSPYVTFIMFTTDIIDNIKNISELINCLDLSQDICRKKNLCTFVEDNTICKLLLPKKHLISNRDNEIIYYKRIVDELLRYGRIRQFILNPQSFISFHKTGYNLKDDEIISHLQRKRK